MTLFYSASAVARSSTVPVKAGPSAAGRRSAPQTSTLSAIGRDLNRSALLPLLCVTAIYAQRRLQWVIHLTLLPFRAKTPDSKWTRKPLASSLFRISEGGQAHSLIILPCYHVELTKQDLTRLPSKAKNRWQVDKEAIGLSRVQKCFIYSEIFVTFLNMLLAFTQSLDNLFHSFIVPCENKVSGI